MLVGRWVGAGRRRFIDVLAWKLLEKFYNAERFRRMNREDTARSSDREATTRSEKRKHHATVTVTTTTLDPHHHHASQTI